MKLLKWLVALIARYFMKKKYVKEKIFFTPEQMNKSFDEIKKIHEHRVKVFYVGSKWKSNNRGGIKRVSPNNNSI